MSGYELYWTPGSCARVPMIALEEIGVDYELHVIDKGRGDHLGAPYRAINPKGRVPTFVADGRVVTENPAILTFLARRHPEAGLLPTDEDAALEALSLMCWFGGGIHAEVPRLRFPQFFSRVPESLASVREIARTNLEAAFTILEGRLDGRPWVLGDTWSILDAWQLWLWFRATGSGMDGRPYPRCADHAQRTEARPSVARALDREEAEHARLLAQGTVPDRMPPHQVGRAPVVGAVPAG